MENDKQCIRCGASYEKGTRCKPCHTALALAWRKAHLEERRAQSRAYYYKLSPAQYTEWLASQDNKCSICLREFTETIKPYIDHDHTCCPSQRTCGKCIRGILCNDCNTLLGKAGDNPLYFIRALKYLGILSGRTK